MKNLLIKLTLLGFLSFSVVNVIAADGLPLNVALPALAENQEMLVLEVNLEPGQGSAPHRHNAYVFVYVLEGKVNMQVAGGEMVTLSPGEMFYENPDNVHTVSQNASDTETAKFLVHMIRTIGTPVSVPVE
ncbi:MAG: cupin domain-containing protein [Gammaproteobacteria bacterium]|nr:cupin domain-containing protein [Gammaproteobacteria bacterium]